MFSAKDILWVRNVKKDGGNSIAYYGANENEEFLLNWSSWYKDKKEASKAQIGDVILLFQWINSLGGVQLTHLVTPIDYEILIGNNPDFKWIRKVKVIARAPEAHNPKPDILNFKKPNRAHTYRLNVIDTNRPLIEIQTIVWNCFEGMLKEGLDNIEESILNQNLGDIDLSAFEGNEKIAFKKHLLRERSSKLIEEKKQRAIVANNLKCECCEFNFESNYGFLGTGFIECHHKIPINQGERITNLDDLALVCSNCHRMLHRKNSDGEYFSVLELKSLIKSHK